jgi:hypothetical protein
MASTPAVATAEREGIRFTLHEGAGSYGDEATERLAVDPRGPSRRRGLQMELDPRDLVRLTEARVHEIASRT